MPTSYRDEQRERWDSLAAAHGSTEPLRAVIGSTPLGNDYLDRTTKRFLGKLLRVGTSDVVLDYGCGVGRLALWLAPQVEQVIAMDISPKMIDVATAESVRRGIDNATFAVAEGYTLPVETASVDVVICGSVLKYVLDDDDLAVLVGVRPRPERWRQGGGDRRGRRRRAVRVLSGSEEIGGNVPLTPRERVPRPLLAQRHVGGWGLADLSAANSPPVLTGRWEGETVAVACEHVGEERDPDRGPPPHPRDGEAWIPAPVLRP